MSAATPERACRTCGGSGSIMVPDSSGESASEYACPDPVHDEEPVTAATPREAAERAFAATGDWEMAAEAALVAARLAAQQPEPAPAIAALEKVASSHERVMYAATIDLALDRPVSAQRLLVEQLDGFEGDPWNGTETGAQRLERTREENPK